MKIRGHRITIIRDKMTRVVKFPWAWETPLWEAKYPGGNVIVDGTTETERDSLPDADDEYHRLLVAIGTENETNIPHIYNEYGRGREGVKALQKAIKAAEVKPRKAKAKAKPKPKVASQPDDPLA